MTPPTADRRAVRAWITYDWANSAFATTVLAAVLPTYFASVAGATLPSAATATQYYTITLSVSVAVVALASPLLGSVADRLGLRKRLLLGFAATGMVATALLYLVETGDWLLAAVLFGIGRIGFGGANVFYDALLPHVAAPDEQDAVSARGYALGYLGGGLLLAANVVMITLLPGALGARLSLLSVALWWALFTVPLARHVPEPPGDATLPGGGLIAEIRAVAATLRGLRAFVDLRRYLLAYLLFNDAINTVIAVAAIYGVELGFATQELILAILLVQFAGIPFSLAFGNLTRPTPRRPALLVWIVLLILLLPAVGITLRLTLPADVSGAARGSAPRAETELPLSTLDLQPPFSWGVTEEAATTSRAGASASLVFEGQAVQLTYTASPDGGVVHVRLDDRARTELDTSAGARRTGETVVYVADEAGVHTLTLELAPSSRGEPSRLTIEGVTVVPPPRAAELPLILGALAAVVLAALVVALALGGRLARGAAARLTTKAGIELALLAYLIVAVWGFALDSVVEFWFLAFLVAVVQGGSQALARSLYARLVPEHRSGEFFGFFSVLSKFASILSPLLFVAAVAWFGSSRPAVLALAAPLGAGMWLLRGVDVARGARLAAAAGARAQPPGEG